ncbi:GNAT family N-acetyltransferase [Niallia sp. XMNu-256]|uniref:GNAT family N-acetyltransferase n=1 Tax=Niallia sp. XMNu-256 TaxID=3082444 RepID=UPI0030D219D4
MKYSDEIKILHYWSDQLPETAINDFIYIQRRVFQSNFNIKRFKKKYFENIYGPSIIVLAYYEDRCIGARAFWRNDIHGNKAYQPCDTAVLEEYRGKGIFGKMTKVALNQNIKDSYIYNFPNDNSLGGYRKLSWEISLHMKYKFFNSKVDINNIDRIDSSYLKWLISRTYNPNYNSLYYSYIKGSYFLVKKRKFNLYLIIGEVDREYALNLPKTRFPIHLVYSTKGYFGRGVVFATKNIPENIKIPLYKMDTLF